MIIFYFLMVYLIYAVFISIMHEAFKNIGIEKGDPLVTQEINWRRELKRFLKWFFAFLPESTLKRFGQYDIFEVDEKEIIPKAKPKSRKRSRR